MRAEYLKDIKRIVIKIGTKSLTHNIKIDNKKVKKLTKEIAQLKNKGFEIVLVSSGAVSAGIGELNLKNRPKNIPEKQAAASIGQITLMSKYHDYFKSYKIKIGQVLLTESDLKERKKYLNAKNTLTTLIKQYNVVPIINENDVVGIEELIFGDNDELSALIAGLIDADLLILLTDIEGFYLNGKLMKYIEKLTDEIVRSAGDKDHQFSSGGMKSKLKAVNIAIKSGIPSVIANSATKDVIKKILQGDDEGTFFCSFEKCMSHKKRWLAYSVVSHGRLIIDQGAVQALLKRGKSLLAGGIVKAEGRFEKGEPVNICDKKGNSIGRGLINYNRRTIEQIKGMKTDKIREILKDKFYREVIHRDNLVMFQ